MSSRACSAPDARGAAPASRAAAVGSGRPAAPRAAGLGARRARLALAGGAAWLLLVPRAPIAAQAGEPPRLDATETSVGAYYGNNRDGLADNDDYSAWLNRLSLQLTWDRLVATARLDSAFYGAPPTADYLASQAISPAHQAQNCDLVNESLAGCYDRQHLQAERALLNRYRATIYPSKVAVAYATPTLELTLGDFYAQFGRGLTLSVRKVDEFAFDTTIRGAKVDWSWRNDHRKLSVTVLAGYGNPVRVDEVSGRRLVAPESWVFAGMPTFDAGSSYSPATAPTFRPDGLFGVRVEGGTDRVVVGAYGSLVARGGPGQLVGSADPSSVVFPGSSDPVREAKYLETASASLSLPHLGELGAGYLEAATQRLSGGTTAFGSAAPPERVVTGQALTGSLSLDTDRWLALLEIRHTRRFSPLRANVDTLSASEFVGLQYSAPPTTGPITQDTEFNRFADCTTGGRAHLDYRRNENLIVYGSVGYYQTWSERFGDCGVSGGGLLASDRDDVWDPFVGIIVTYNQNRSRANLWGGARFDQAAEPAVTASGASTREFYREAYLRYDAIHTIDDTWAVQMQGTHRARAETDTDAHPWKEGENYLGVHWDSKIIATFGYEYTTRFSNPLSYFNGSVFYRLPRGWLPGDSNLRVFVGQQRGALRCINGVCKVFPDFTGARVELVLRF